MFLQNNGNEIGMDRLRALVPSIFAQERGARTSARYEQYPTSRIIEAMGDAGWAPVAAAASLARSDGHFQASTHGKHMVRFCRRDQLGGNVERRVEALVTNSHDGTSSYRLHAAVFRLVCSNGLVVSDADFAAICVAHRGDDAARVVSASLEVLGQIPALEARVDEARGHRLTATERLAFAEMAAEARWGEAPPVEPARLLVPRRSADYSDDAWTTLNVVQENTIAGGLSGRSRETGRAVHTRPIRAVTENVALNKFLWDLMTRVRAGEIAPREMAVV